MATTYQLRHYTLDPALAGEFIDFMRTRVIPLRQRLGFTVEELLLSADRTAFTWLVSVDGDEAAFGQVEQAWVQSPERARIFDGIPRHVLRQDVGFVQRLEP